MASARTVKTDFDSKKITNLHPDPSHKTRSYHSNAVEKIALDFWEKEATIIEPSYRKVRKYWGRKGHLGVGGVLCPSN